jgi:hypothetical protein
MSRVGCVGERGRPRMDIGTGRIYRWRRELCGAVAGFAEVVVSPPPCERLEGEAASVEVAFGADIPVRIPVTTPADLACAIIKAIQHAAGAQENAFARC